MDVRWKTPSSTVILSMGKSKQNSMLAASCIVLINVCVHKLVQPLCTKQIMGSKTKMNGGNAHFSVLVLR